jgi:hypothetical protein
MPPAIIDACAEACGPWLPVQHLRTSLRKKTNLIVCELAGMAPRKNQYSMGGGDLSSNMSRFRDFRRHGIAASWRPAIIALLAEDFWPAQRGRSQIAR